MATSTTRITFAEFENLPNVSHAGFELHHGELVPVPFPKMKHVVIQQRLRSLLDQAAGDRGTTITELGFRALPENEYRRADVAFVVRARWERADPEDHFRGAPDMVIEVLSPSNTAAEMLDKENLCLENGSREFWVVDIDRRQIKVSTPDGHTVRYKSGDNIPLFFGGALAIDEIFS